MPEPLDDATVEAIAKAMHVEGAWCGDCEFAGWDSCADCRKVCLAYARVAIAALPDPRPTEAEFDEYLDEHGGGPRGLRLAAWALGCFRPEAGDPDA